MRFSISRLSASMMMRVLLAAVVALVVTVLLSSGVLMYLLTRESAPAAWEGLTDQANAVANGLQFDDSGHPGSVTLPPDRLQLYDALVKDTAFLVFDDAGNELLSSQEGPALVSLRSLPVWNETGLSAIDSDGILLRVLTVPFRHDARDYTIRVARSERLASAVRRHGLEIAFFAVFCVTVLAVVVFSCAALWAAYRTARSLRSVSAAAAAIQPENLTQRLDGSGLPGELAPLIDAFNRSLDRLEKGYRVQQDFLASAAHELKTPLTLIRAEIELGSAPNRETLLKDVDDMARQVHQLLQLAEVSETQNYVFEPLDMGAVLDEAIAYTSRLADGKGVFVELRCPVERLTTNADRGAVLILAKNLIENAIHHSPLGERIGICLDARGFRVIDAGPGVAPTEEPKLFTRFWRSPRARHDGAGLGLSICREIAAAHRWQLSYRPAEPGPGAEFRVTF